MVSLRVSRGSRVPSVSHRRSPAPPQLPAAAVRLPPSAPRSFADRQTPQSTPFGRCPKGILCAGTRPTALHSLPAPRAHRRVPREAALAAHSEVDTGAPPALCAGSLVGLRRSFPKPGNTRHLTRDPPGAQETVLWVPCLRGQGEREAAPLGPIDGHRCPGSHSPSKSGCSSKAAPVPAPGAAGSSREGPLCKHQSRRPDPPVSGSKGAA